MPEPSTLLLFAVAAVALIAIPGPNLIYIATRSMSEGRRSGLASVLGVETGTLIHSLAAALGISALVASSATAFEVIRYAGAAYLVYLGVRELARRREAPDGDAPRPEPSLARAYRQGVLVQVLNPKVALFFLAFLPQFVDPERGSVATQVLVLGAVLAFLGASLSSLWALGAGALGERLGDRPSLAQRGRYLTGAVYILLGAAAALTGGRKSS